MIATMLAALYRSHFKCEAMSMSPLATSGGYRRYFRLSGPGGMVIGTYGSNVEENRAFFYLSNHFLRKGRAVPKVLAISDDELYYLQTDAGNKTLFETLASARSDTRFDADAIILLRNSLRLLASMQQNGAEGIDFKKCYPESEMHRRQILWDLNYFKYSFLKPVMGDVDETRLQDDLDLLADEIEAASSEATTFMVRDFQSRNVMVDTDGHLTLIDFQGGRRGPVEYDVASFLWQAKASIPKHLRHTLVDDYISYARALNEEFSAALFRQRLPFFVVFRVLQTLGAYGFRGLCEQKPHFVSSISPGIRNLKNVIEEFGLQSKFPYLSELATQLLKTYTLRCLETIISIPASNPDSLTVCVSSFSYKRGVPIDLSGNGGGFVFDCRAIHNPGRYEQYRQLTGRDESVKKFLEDDGEVFEFLSATYSLTDNSIARYLKRGFTSLCVAFGCTGGQHRSVYCAEAMARHVKSQFPMVRVLLWHREQNRVELI